MSDDPAPLSICPIPPPAPDITPEEAVERMIECAPGLQDGSISHEYISYFSTEPASGRDIRRPPVEWWRVIGCFREMTQPVKARALKLRQAVEKFKSQVTWRREWEAPA